ncbi:hypothetical protein BJ684DRAFT_14661 [Piptocephalis cylindrospora]|uniref:Uncharacterized protein n=1 Tax=Piptocephalis cylindrospora TaxID=1907219 RepID=A0A4P9YAF5_9FUNG|nr:hypothetical protein BJ684DRAFT_14661 [Piptocephalis cylindrospora]|eukprot:RKP15060.1 hypothetical protein BJ684DRAFT_14661 [Piptocephalis cylindrospora]
MSNKPTSSAGKDWEVQSVLSAMEDQTLHSLDALLAPTEWTVYSEEEEEEEEEARMCPVDPPPSKTHSLTQLRRAGRGASRGGMREGKDMAALASWMFPQRSSHDLAQQLSHPDYLLRRRLLDGNFTYSKWDRVKRGMDGSDQRDPLDTLSITGTGSESRKRERGKEGEDAKANEIRRLQKARILDMALGLGPTSATVGFIQDTENTWMKDRGTPGSSSSLNALGEQRAPLDTVHAPSNHLPSSIDSSSTAPVRSSQGPTSLQERQSTLDAFLGL